MEQYLLDKNWEYVESGLLNPLMVNMLNGWKKTDLPHDYSMEKERSKDAPSGLDEGFTRGAGLYYKKSFILEETIKDKKVWIEFEGVSGYSEVWVNGKFLIKHVNPYTSFWVDITSFVKVGENVISLHTDSSAKPNSRWYVGAGIYRPVHLYISNKTAIIPHELKITTNEVNNNKANISLQMNVGVSFDDIDKEVPIVLTVLDKNNNCVYKEEYKEKLSDEITCLNKTIDLDNINPWSINNPELYVLNVSIDDDEYKERFGIRTIEVNSKEGFKLNGESIKLKGGCIHHDLGILGSAEYRDGDYFKIKKLKDSGFNALRLAHNPYGNTFFNVCDELGMLVIEEAFDEWVLGRTSFGSHLFFEKSWQEDLEAMIKRDYNHPSIIMWSTGNEVEERDGSADGYYWSKKLADKVKELDASRPVSATACSLFVEYTNLRPKMDDSTTGNQALNMAYDNFASGVDLWGDQTKEYFAPLDVAGYNYKNARYKFDHEKFPDRVIYGSESYPRAAFESWQDTLNNNHVIGDFVWTAFDYIGEVGVGRWEVSDMPMPIPSKWPWLLANCSDIDLIGEKRPQSYYRDALWENDHLPHLFTLSPDLVGKNIARLSWAWLPVERNYTFDKEGETIEAHIYANADEVELLLNDKSLGRKPCNKENKYIAIYSFPYKKGKLEAISYIDGKEVGRDVLNTTSNVSSLKLIKDKEELISDNRSLMFILINALDENNNLVFNENREIKVELENATLVALGTANPKPDKLIPYRLDNTSLYNGKALLAIKSDSKENLCKVKISLDNITKEIEIPLVHKEEKESLYVKEVVDGALNLTIGELLDNSETKKVLEEFLPELVNNPMISRMKSMTLKKISSMSGMPIPKELETKLEECNY